MRYPIILVNYAVQIVRVKFIACAWIAGLHAGSFQLLEYLINSLVSAHTVIDQFVDRFCHRIVHVAADRIGRKARLVARFFLNNPCRYTDRRSAGWNISDDNGIGSDARPVTDCYRAQNLGAGPQHHPIAQRGMALAFIPRCAAERDAVVNSAVVADFSGFADHNANAMIDEKAAPDLRSGMDLNTGKEAAEMRCQAREPPQPCTPQIVRKAVHQQCMKTRVAGDDFPSVARCRIALEYNRYLFFKTSK